MKRGKLQKMISVRDLLRNMRTHSVLAVGVSVALVTVLCGTIASNVLGTIEADASSIETNTQLLAEQMESDSRSLEAYVGELRARMNDIRESLDIMENSITSGEQAVQIIERSVAEINSIEEPVREAFGQVVKQMDTVLEYIGDDRVPVGNILRMTDGKTTVPPEERAQLETLEEQADAATMTVIRQYTMLSADVSAITDKLRTYDVQARPFHDAIRTLEDCFFLGMRGVQQARSALGEEENGPDETTTLMLARLQLSMDAKDTVTERAEAPSYDVESLRSQVQASNDRINALQQELAVAGAQLGELTTALQDMNGNIRTMQAQVDGAVQAGEAGRDAMVRMGIEQQETLDAAAEKQQEALDGAVSSQKKSLEEAADRQQKAWDATAEKQQETLDAATEKQQETLDAATEKQQETLDAATGKQQETLDAAAEKQQETLDAAAANQQETLDAAAANQQETLDAAAEKQQETLDAAAEKQQETLDAAAASQQETLDAAAEKQQAALNAAAEKQQAALDAAAGKQQATLEAAAASQQAALEKAAANQQEMLGQAVLSSASARGERYVTVTFTFNYSIYDTGYTFDFSQVLSNCDSITSEDILVRSFTTGTTGKCQFDMGIGATINLDTAGYDPVNGRLTVVDKLLNSPFGSQSGTVTFAVIGGILK